MLTCGGIRGSVASVVIFFGGEGPVALWTGAILFTQLSLKFTCLLGVFMEWFLFSYSSLFCSEYFYPRIFQL